MIKIGVVNIDTSHPLAFSEILLKENRARYAAVFNDGFRGDDEVESFIKKRGLEIKFNTRAKEITKSGVICEAEGDEKVFSADTIVYAVGQQPLREEAVALGNCAPEFYMIGDCVSPRNIMDATSEAFHIARKIGQV